MSPMNHGDDDANERPRDHADGRMSDHAGETGSSGDGVGRASTGSPEHPLKPESGIEAVAPIGGVTGSGAPLGHPPFDPARSDASRCPFLRAFNGALDAFRSLGGDAMTTRPDTNAQTSEAGHDPDAARDPDATRDADSRAG
jgi:hypothetical protein